MKLSEMSIEQRREYNKKIKSQSRERQRQEQLTKQIPNFDDYQMPESQQRRLSDHTEAVLKSIRLETAVTDRDEWIIDSVARVLFGLENDVKQKVNDPSGLLVGGSFPDAAWSIAIEHVHRFPAILKSTTFADLYQKFLGQVLKWNNQTHAAYSAPELVEVLKAEIAGTYVLPTLAPPEPQVPPAPIEPPANAPGDDEIRELGRVQLLSQLGLDSNIPQDARRYLEGQL
jgi:hypothetical protein